MNRQEGCRTGAWVLCVTAMVVVPGCLWSIDVNGNGDDPNTVVIRLVNESWTLAVRPLLYATGQPVTDATTELFIPANVVSGIGVAGSGVIDTRKSDEVTLDCSDAWAIGTPGAVFVDDNGNPQGTTDQVVQIQGQGVLGCGKTITITFRSDGDSTFTADVSSSGG